MATNNQNTHKPTKGEVIAKEIREKSNSLSDSQRDELIQSAMMVIYGGDGGKAAVRCN
jgi:hypothetical protein